MSNAKHICYNPLLDIPDSYSYPERPPNAKVEAKARKDSYLYKKTRKVKNYG